MSVLDGKITVNDIRKAMNLKLKAAKRLNRFLYKNYNIWIFSEMRDSDFAEEYLLENLMNIKFYKQPDHEQTLSFYYYVGTKGSMPTSIHNACTIRKVVSQTGDLEFEELLPLMAVEFVRMDSIKCCHFRLSI